jgi:hypothetical protein
MWDLWWVKVILGRFSQSSNSCVVVPSFPPPLGSYEQYHLYIITLVVVREMFKKLHRVSYCEKCILVF